jgi:trehalose 6-phosphate phosphatase
LNERHTLVRPRPTSVESPNRGAQEAPSPGEGQARVRAELGRRPDALPGVAVDRLDHAKGIEERLAVERLLDRARTARRPLDRRGVGDGGSGMTSDVLAPEQRDVLVHFAQSNALVALDYDGTLAPIVATPDEARMRDTTRGFFRRLSDRFPTVVISGREQADVEARLEGLGLFAVIGNHGIEPWEAREAYRGQSARWTVALRPLLERCQGAWIEDKQYSVAVHYRQSRDPLAARRAILSAASSLRDARVVTGKRVCNIVPATAPDKGTALAMARESLGCDTAIYVGDDDTDEDVFRLRPEWPLLTVRVGRRRDTRARFHLRDQREIDQLLALLVQLRLPHPTPGDLAAGPGRWRH